MADALQPLIDGRYPSTTVDIIRKYFADEKIPADQQAAVVAYLLQNTDNTGLDPDTALDQVRNAHWQVMTPDQRAQYPQPQGGGSNWFGAVVGHSLGLDGSSSPAPADAPAPTPAPTPGGSTVTSAGGAPVAVPALGAPYQPNIAQYGPVSAQTYTGATDAASLAALAGMDTATFTKMYNDYVNNFTQTAAGRSAEGDSAGHQLTMQEFAANRATAVQGQWQPALDALDYAWNAQYGSRMPADLRNQLLAALNGLDHNQQQAVLAAELQYVQGLTSARGQATGVAGALQSLNATLLNQMPPSIGTLTTQYRSAHLDIPTEVAAEQKVRQQTYIDWMVQHGMQVDPALLAKLMTMTDNGGSFTNPQSGTAEAYLLGLPSDIHGMTWGAKDIAMANMGGLWRAAFGKEPSNAELLWSVGKSSQDIQSFIDNSPSSIPGVTIGRKNDYETFITGLGTSSATTHAFSAGVDDSLIHDLHQQVTQQSTGTAHPGPM